MSHKKAERSGACRWHTDEVKGNLGFSPVPVSLTRSGYPRIIPAFHRRWYTERLAVGSFASLSVTLQLGAYDPRDISWCHRTKVYPLALGPQSRCCGSRQVHSSVQPLWVRLSSLQVFRSKKPGAKLLRSRNNKVTRSNFSTSSVKHLWKGNSFWSLTFQFFRTWLMIKSESPYTSNSLIPSSRAARSPAMQASYSAALLLHFNLSLNVTGILTSSGDTKTAPIPLPAGFRQSRTSTASVLSLRPSSLLLSTKRVSDRSSKKHFSHW